MKNLNLNELMVSVTDLKKELSKIIANNLTKIIVRNNKPVSILMPYSDYLNINKNEEILQNKISQTGDDITLPNGVQMKVCVETPSEESERGEVEINTYIKMKTSGEYKLHYTLRLSTPNENQNLTNEEIIEAYSTRKETLDNEGEEQLSER